MKFNSTYSFNQKRSIIHWFFLFSGLVFSPALVAQHYMTTAGVRLGTDWGFSIQQRILDRATGEFIFQNSLSREESNITLLFEQHSPLISRGFNIYTGAGLHVGWNSEPPEKMIKNPFGVTAIIGAEFTLGSLNLSYDFKPAFNLKGGEKTVYAQSGVSLRYVFLKNRVYKDMVKAKKKKKKQAERDQRRAERGKEWWEVWKKKKPNGG